MSQDPAHDPASAEQRVPSLEHALTLAYAYLNRRERTRHELREHLLGRDLPPDVVELAVDELGREGYVDDERFTRVLIQDKGGLEQWGSERIRRALVTRGIPAEMADVAVAEESGWNDELERALGLLERRFPAGLDGRKQSERALGVLLRKGYEYELAADALSQHRRRSGAGGRPQAA